MEEKKEKFSYSKLSSFESCGWKYKLQYIDKHFVDSSTIANEFGTLIHFVEETIALDIIENNNEPIFLIDDNKYIDLFINADIEQDGKKVLGVKKLKEKYPEDFYTADKSGLNYEDKANDYLNFGIFRLRDYLNEHRDIQIIGVEIPFKVEYRNYVFHGFIDRLLKNTSTGQYYIEDIKTWNSIDKANLKTPLQFVFYTLAAEQMFNTDNLNICCFYDLPFTKTRYAAGTKGFMTRGLKKIDSLLSEIESEVFEPKPSPLCHWCQFCKTNPNQPDETKNLCPYYNKYKKGDKYNPNNVDFVWMGMENHEAIMEAFLKQESKTIEKEPKVHLTVKDQEYSDRIFMLRR